MGLKTEDVCRREYGKEVLRQFDPYKQWIKEKESEPMVYPDSQLTSKVITMEECTGDWNLASYQEDVVILYSKQGELDKRAVPGIVTYLQMHPDIALVYADEDYILEEEIPQKSNYLKVLHQIGIDVEHYNPEVTGRIAPWFKPDFSPDTLLSFQYFGNIVAVRTEKIRMADIPVMSGEDSTLNLYDFFLKVSEKEKIGHISEVFFHRNGLPEDAFLQGAGSRYNAIKEQALKRRGRKADLVADEEGYVHIRELVESQARVSIIVLSKDHPNLVKQCMESIRSLTIYENYEILLVDNGSNEENREKIEKMSEQYKFAYYYEPMEFNFSKLCNFGAKKATGNYYLFLNDDIEILQKDWLSIMVGQCSLKHVGAVGAKLLYPNSKTIQHVGISNIEVGPVHRLHNYSDENSMYYGRNRVTYDYIGVTAACMLIRKDVYEKMGGFCEEIAVAYNDVDLCFRLYEAGYTQVVRNDVTCYHHESISRGKDEFGEKKKRLDQERTLLYERHPNLSKEQLGKRKNGMDPYCRNTERWKRNSLFMAGYLYEQERKECITKIQKIKNGSYLNEDTDAMISAKYLRKPRKRFWDRSNVMISVDARKQEDSQYILEGWALLTKNDNCLYKKHMLLKNKNGDVYVIEPWNVLREDVVYYIEGQTNVYLAGFVLRLPVTDIPKDTYQIGVLFTGRNTKKRYADYAEEFWELE